MPLGHGADAAPIVVHDLRAVLRCRALACVVVVAPPDDDGMQQLAAALDDAFPGLTAGGVPGPVVSVVAGGAERSDSVSAGLAALPPGAG